MLLLPSIFTGSAAPTKASTYPVPSWLQRVPQRLVPHRVVVALPVVAELDGRDFHVELRTYTYTYAHTHTHTHTSARRDGHDSKRQRQQYSSSTVACTRKNSSNDDHQHDGANKKRTTAEGTRGDMGHDKDMTKLEKAKLRRDHYLISGRSNRGVPTAPPWTSYHHRSRCATLTRPSGKRRTRLEPKQRGTPPPLPQARVMATPLLLLLLLLLRTHGETNDIVSRRGGQGTFFPPIPRVKGVIPRAVVVTLHPSHLWLPVPLVAQPVRASLRS